jgi:sterol desaturase/sphingolipid hydroxylase (fatty acid hydroxylase superfamily)
MAKRAWNELLNSKGKVLMIAFGVMGFLAIPLIIKSPAFSSFEKWGWSTLVTLWTLLLFFLAGLTLYWCYHRIVTPLSVWGPLLGTS